MSTVLLLNGSNYISQLVSMKCWAGWHTLEYAQQAQGLLLAL